MSRLVILLAEDNAADVVFFREALAEAGFQARLEVVGTGEDAIRFLRRRRSFDQAPRPDVVVLDLNLPIRNGQEVLAEMASDPVLNTIPVAILTTSAFDAGVCDLYPSGRCLYLTKTDDLGQLREVMRQIAAHAGATQPADAVESGQADGPSPRVDGERPQIMSEPVHRMLVIEDNVGDAFLLSEHLRDVTGAPEVVIRRNLAEGLELAASGGFSAVLLDLSLPDSYGLDTLRRVRSALPGVPVIVLTGLEDEQLRDEILGAGAKGYLVKGAATADILQAIARAIA